ncbi:MAG: PQQ-binding-like beta-propeller repeat protein [Bacteroidales bacterium]|nr:PQQ-binding-like beta-propeller repeat protein [Bacteroidales bacterium]
MKRYLIQDVIGSGGMGSVYRARDMHFPNAVKLVAIKEMVSTTTDIKVNQLMVRSFEREANLLVTLSHPQITNIYDYFTIDQRAYLVIEYVYGKDLEKILDRVEGFIPEEQIIKWAVQLCDVLDYLHSHEPEPIIFRDMKPSNVMINRQGNAVLIDFGIAKTFQLGKKGTIIGTEGYAPPEQYRGESTRSVDIYALGATLHHALTSCDPTSEPPFTFDQRKIKDFNPSISDELVQVVEKALEYDASIRCNSAKDMKDAILQVGHETGLLTGVNSLLFSNSGIERGISSSKNAPADQLIKPVWTFKCEDEIRGGVFLDNNDVYIGAYDNNIYKIGAADGKFIWKYAAEGGIVCTPVVTGSNLYFGSEDGKVYGIKTSSANKIWEFKTGGAVRCSPALAEDHVFIGSDDCNLYVLTQSQGSLSWKVESMAPIRCQPLIHDELVYVANTKGEFLCTDMSGYTKWRYSAKRAILGTPIIDDDILYFSSLDATFYAVDAKAGWAMWRFRMDKGSVSSPVLHGKYIYFGSADGYIYCINKVNGKLVWSYQTEGQVSGSVVLNDDLLFVGNAEGFMFALDRTEGSLQWKFKTEGPITSKPVIYNDLLIFGSSDKLLYALPI